MRTSPAVEPAANDLAPDWAVVDVETSGLRPGLHRVLSVAVITLSPDGRQTGEYSTLLNPGCDPGPVHIHGLTSQRLRGAPGFERVADRIGQLLAGRVMVAHNAQFDYDFLAQEFALAGVAMPVGRRLCTVALNRRVGTPTENLKLGTLAAYYGVSQMKAHDALDDTRVLTGVLRGSLVEAARLGVPLPLVECPPRRVSSFPARPSKAPCAFRSPGRYRPGGSLVQGMKVAFTGETDLSREDLVGRAVAAGLNVMTSVSRHTGLLVDNGWGDGSAKSRRAVAEGVPVLSERDFLALLGNVEPGEPHSAPALSPAVAPVRRREPTAAGPLTGRRVLVLGGRHDAAVEARTRVVGLGGAAAVNLSRGVTDVIALPGAEDDRRMVRVTALGIPVHQPGWPDSTRPEEVPPAGPAESAEAAEAAQVLARGGVIDLPVSAEGEPWTVNASWAQLTDCEVDVVAFSVDEDEQVGADEDFVFYGAPLSPDGSVELAVDGPTEQAVKVALDRLPDGVRKVVVAAALDRRATFGELGAVELTITEGPGGRSVAQATLDAATTERTLLLAELYRRGPVWRVRAVGQGYDHGLAELARGYGVDIAD